MHAYRHRHRHRHEGKQTKKPLHAAAVYAVSPTCPVCHAHLCQGETVGRVIQHMALHMACREDLVGRDGGVFCVLEGRVEVFSTPVERACEVCKVVKTEGKNHPPSLFPNEIQLHLHVLSQHSLHSFHRKKTHQPIPAPRPAPPRIHTKYTAVIPRSGKVVHNTSPTAVPPNPRTQQVYPIRHTHAVHPFWNPRFASYTSSTQSSYYLPSPASPPRKKQRRRTMLCDGATW